MNEEGEYTGIFKLRPKLNELLKNGAGHIGFGIHPSYRRQGYATKGFALILQEAKKQDVDIVLSSCFKTNIGSYKAQIKNGAMIIREDENKYYFKTDLRSF